MKPGSILVDIICPNTRTRNTLEFALQQHGKGRFNLGRGSHTDLVIVDYEKAETKEEFRMHRQRFPSCPALLLLNTANDFDDFPEIDRTGSESLLVRPFSVRELITAVEDCLANATSGNAAHQNNPASNTESSKSEKSKLDFVRKPTVKSVDSPIQQNNQTHLSLPNPASIPAIRETTQKISASVSGNGTSLTRYTFQFAYSENINLNDIAEVESRWIKTDTKLLGHITRALKQNVSSPVPVCLSMKGRTRYYLAPTRNSITLTGEILPLLDLALLDIDGDQISLVNDPLTESDSQLQVALDAFLWKLSLYTYRGMLPEGITATEPVYLKYWPNLTRFEPTPNAMRIASLWCRQPVSLGFMIRMLNIPQSHVFNFYAAANTLGLAGPAIRDADSMLQPTFNDTLNQDHSLIQRIARKLNASGKQSL